MPAITLERILGVIILYLSLLIWMQMGAMLFLVEVADRQGGGAFGRLLTLPMVSGFGFTGGVFINLFLLWMGIMFTFDITFARLWLKTQPLRIAAIERFHQLFRQPLPSETEMQETDEDDRVELPEVFKPITSIGETQPETNGRKVNGETHESSISSHKPHGNVDDDLFEDSITAPPPDIDWSLPEVTQHLVPIPEFEDDDSQVEQQARIIEETLDLLGAPGHVVEIAHGPRVTQFGIEPDFNEKRSGDKVRVRVNKVVSLADDLTMALASQSVRIQAPVPGKSYIGIEVPNTKAQPVTLLEIIESQAFRDLRSPLRFGLGKDVTGRPVAANLKSMPHLLIAGTTGAGKSVCINAILCNFLLFNSPRDLRLLLVDPKRVELTGYNGIPHLLTPVVVDMDKVVNALQWILREMETRYHKFSKVGARNLVGFNQKRPEEYLPHIVVVIDELADLMMTAPGETEAAITRLAQLARATGIHLILATQRPSTKVITGLIKANFPSRIAFNVATGIDSRVILDQNGAERLLGSGDMLFKPADAPAPFRLQGVYLSDDEIESIVRYWQTTAQEALASRKKGTTGTTPAITPSMPMHQESLWDIDNKIDPLEDEAIDLVRKEGRASTTMLQRRLRIGYTRAARLIDSLEQKGIVGEPHPTTQVREVLDFGPAGPPLDLD